MKPCIKAKEIPREMKAMLPEIPRELREERFCTFCPYYAGIYAGARRCMVRTCAWDNEKRYFHPALREFLNRTREVVIEAERKYMETKKRMETLESMFAEELAEEERKEDKCYRCPYGRALPCIGICYADLTRKRGVKDE